MYKVRLLNAELILLMLSIEDYRTSEIDIRILLISIILMFIAGEKFHYSGVVLGFIFLLIAIITKEAIGKGDAYLFMYIGLCYGAVNTMVIILISSILVLIFFTVFKHKTPTLLSYKASVPYVPFAFMAFNVFVIANNYL